MNPYLVPPELDTARTRRGEQLTVQVDEVPATAFRGQTVAAVLLAMGRPAWRDTRFGHRPRGVFCGIGVCFDCLVVVNGVPDVRACLRRVEPGDEIRTQHGAELPDDGRSAIDPQNADQPGEESS